MSHGKVKIPGVSLREGISEFASHDRRDRIALTKTVGGPPEETKTMNQHQCPKGWDAQRVKQLIAELDTRSDEEWIAAGEAAASDEGDSDIGDER